MTNKFMQKSKAILLSIFSATILLLLAAGGAHKAWADDTSADAPMYFSEAFGNASGVILRVPINAAGEENTDAAEIRFYQGERSSISEETISNAWSQANPLRDDEVLLGLNGPAVNPNNDTSTWGWYYWRWNGWAYPYYYASYYPTFYYYNYWCTFSYNWYWNFGYYRYYFYWY